MNAILSYIARKDEFEKAITSLGQLRVHAVQDDGETYITTLDGYIKEVELAGAWWNVRTDTMKPGQKVKVFLI
jgi:hypothetical protein